MSRSLNSLKGVLYTLINGELKEEENETEIKLVYIGFYKGLYARV